MLETLENTVITAGIFPKSRDASVRKAAGLSHQMSKQHTVDLWVAPDPLRPPEDSRQGGHPWAAELLALTEGVPGGDREFLPLPWPGPLDGDVMKLRGGR
ncbi:hypothetical protein ACOMHN_038298 [Nucella lapillus]